MFPVRRLDVENLSPFIAAVVLLLTCIAIIAVLLIRDPFAPIGATPSSVIEDSTHALALQLFR
ncbi:MAG: hypothetical protein ACJ79R_23505 [Anaeromyxobacteraceae bacterium]